MADDIETQTQQVTSETPATKPADDIETQTQRVTSETPATKPAKNPKRVAAGKLVAERTRLAREAQKKAAAEVAAQKNTPAPSPPQPQPTDDTVAEAAISSKDAISTTQWLAIGSFVVSLIGLYYKREEIKSALSAKGPPPPETSLTPVVPSKIPVANKNPAKGLRSMD